MSRVSRAAKTWRTFAEQMDRTRTAFVELQKVWEEAQSEMSEGSEIPEGVEMPGGGQIPEGGRHLEGFMAWDEIDQEQDR